MPTFRDDPRTHHMSSRRVQAAFPTSEVGEVEGLTNDGLISYNYELRGPGDDSRAPSAGSLPVAHKRALRAPEGKPPEQRPAGALITEIIFYNVRWTKNGFLIHPDDFQRVKWDLTEAAFEYAHENKWRRFGKRSIQQATRAVRSARSEEECPIEIRRVDFDQTD